MNSVLYHYCVQRFPSREEMGRAAARQVRDLICDLLRRKESIRMIFAAAPSQDEFLEALVKEPAIDFSRITAFHMDEYVGLPKEAPQGFGNFLRDRLFSKAAFRQVHYINGNAADIQAECERYCALLRETPIDIVCLGIGENGHIAFNDPHVADMKDPLGVKAVELDRVCRMQQVHDGCFETLDKVPLRALTLTVPTLMNASHHICIVPARSKAQAVHHTLYDAIGEQCPATALRICRDARIYVDMDSGSLLQRGAMDGEAQGA